MKTLILLALSAIAPLFPAQSAKGWPTEVSSIQIPSSADGSAQPAMACTAPTQGGPRPLLVGLHSWSVGYNQPSNGSIFARWAIAQGWHFIHPHFRGPNRTPAALGSHLAVQDIVDAVEHMKKTTQVDPSRIYLIGASGGGHMALLMAARHPEIWAGVSSWVPISDVAAWHAEHLKNGAPDNYAQNIEAALGGPPDSPDRLKDAAKRSPLTWLANAKDVPLDINHGIHDGRKGSVPFRHSLLAFNQVAAPADQLPLADIAVYYETQQRPSTWPAPLPDALYQNKPVLFRKTSGNSRVTLFDGGHEILYLPALNWLAKQQRGQPATWQITHPIPFESLDTQSGK